MVKTVPIAPAANDLHPSQPLAIKQVSASELGAYGFPTGIRVLAGSLPVCGTSRQTEGSCLAVGIGLVIASGLSLAGRQWPSRYGGEMHGVFENPRGMAVRLLRPR